MTSGKFSSAPISSIVVNRDERQRRKLEGIDELAESINRIGLINPLVVTPDLVLVAGERRYTAMKTLGWTDVPIQYTTDLSEYDLAVIELEENVKRVDLSWQDQCLAIEKFHSLKAKHETDWNKEATAQALGLSEREVNRHISVAKEIIGGNERVANADRFTMALNLVTREAERRRDSVLEDIEVKAAAVQVPKEQGEAPPKKVPPLIHDDFHEWAAAYTGVPFNLLHCDFPYGINVANSPRQNSGIQEFYADSKDVYFALLDTLEMAMSNVVAESAHMVFWFSMDYYQLTYDRLTAMGWKVNSFPLIWHKSDNAGIAPDPQRTPRRTYETAFFCTRGDRKLTQAGAMANSFAYPGKKGPDGIHLSEKPVAMLAHFLRMICDDYSRVLDPTCGSGNALKAATACGAPTVLGIEKERAFYETSCLRYFGDDQSEGDDAR